MTINYLTPETTAARLRVKVNTLAKWRVTGDGPKFVKLSARMVRYIEADVDHWMASRVRSSTCDPGKIE